MRRLLQLFTVTILLCLVTSCFQQEQQEAKAGLDAALTQLAESKGFDTVKIVYQEFSATGGSTTCYYARAHLIIGSSLSETQALQAYTEKLQSLGWELVEGEQYDIEKILKRGEYELAVVSSGGPGVDVKDAVDYAQLRRTYPTIMFVRIDFMLPSRNKC